MSFRTRMGEGIVLFDGGLGTMLQSHAAPGELPELLSLTKPEALKAVHLAYLEAGADVLETNTLNANRLKLQKVGRTVDEVIFAAVRCAKEAVAESGRESYVALSMGPTGAMLEPLGDLPFEDAYEIYAEMARAGARAGADLIIIETVSDLYEVKAALMAAKRETNLPVAVTLTFFANGKLLTGADVSTSAAVVEALGADIVGLNCGLGPKQMLGLMDGLAAAARIPILVNPNAGLPKLVDGESVYTVGPAEFAQDVAALAQKGAGLVGGCCGTTPEHIRALGERISGMQAAPAAASARATITSGSKSIEFGEKVVLAAEVSEDDLEDLADAALEAASDILMLSHSRLSAAVAAVQEVALKPLYIVAKSPKQAEAALRIYNGKPLIGVAGGGDLAEYIRIAREGGAALAVGAEALYGVAAEALGAENVLVDCGEDARLSAALMAKGIRTILRGAGAAALRIEPA